DRFSELLAGPGVLDGERERSLGDSHSKRRNQRPLEVEPAHHYSLALVLHPEQAFRRDAAVVEDELGRLAAPEAHLLELLRNAESRRVCLDEERRDSVHTAGGIGLGVDERYVRNRPVSDEELSPVQNVLVSIAPRRRAHRAERVGARTRLG